MEKVEKKKMTSGMRETFSRTKRQALELLKCKKSVSRISVSIRCLQACWFSKTDGTIYTGHLNNGAYHGEGTLKFTDGLTCSGQFFNGKLTGQGTIVYADKSTYTGQLNNNQFHG